MNRREATCIGGRGVLTRGLPENNSLSDSLTRLPEKADSTFSSGNLPQLTYLGEKLNCRAGAIPATARIKEKRICMLI